MTTLTDSIALEVLDELYRADEVQREAGLPTSQRTRNLTRASGEFLAALAVSLGARHVLEIGSSNGVSTIWFALAMRVTGGKVTGTEIIPERAAEANTNLARAGVADFGQVLAGDAARSLTSVKPGLDLAFIDAEKEDYVAHFQRVFPLLRLGGTIIADNVTSHDISDYQSLVRSHPDCLTTTLEIERGLELTVKLR